MSLIDQRGQRLMLLVRKENICWFLEKRFRGYVSNACILVIGVPLFLSVLVSVPKWLRLRLNIEVLFTRRLQVHELNLLLMIFSKSDTVHKTIINGYMRYMWIRLYIAFTVSDSEKKLNYEPEPEEAKNSS